MIHLEHSIVIKRPVEQVFAFVTKFENFPQWQVGMTQAQQVSAGAVGAGTQIAVTRNFLNQPVEGTVEVTDYQPNKTLAIKTAAGPVSMRLAYAFESGDGNTKIKIVGEIDPQGFFKVAEPLVAREVKSQLENSLANLKKILEV